MPMRRHKLSKKESCYQWEISADDPIDLGYYATTACPSRYSLINQTPRYSIIQAPHGLCHGRCLQDRWLADGDSQERVGLSHFCFENHPSPGDVG